MHKPMKILVRPGGVAVNFSFALFICIGVEVAKLMNIVAERETQEKEVRHIPPIPPVLTTFSATPHNEYSWMLRAVNTRAIYCARPKLYCDRAWRWWISISAQWVLWKKYAERSRREHAWSLGTAWHYWQEVSSLSHPLSHAELWFLAKPGVSVGIGQCGSLYHALGHLFFSAFIRTSAYAVWG